MLTVDGGRCALLIRVNVRATSEPSGLVSRVGVRAMPNKALAALLPVTVTPDRQKPG